MSGNSYNEEIKIEAVKQITERGSSVHDVCLDQVAEIGQAER